MITTPAIVLKTIKYSETSVITTVMTREFGVRKYIIHGVRTGKAKVHANLLQPMTLLEIVAYHKELKGINNVKEVRPAYVFQKLHFEMKRMAVGMFIAELTYKILHESDPNPEMFDMLHSALVFLDTAEPPAFLNTHLWVMAQMVALLGCEPESGLSAERPNLDLREARPTSLSAGNTILDNELAMLFLALFKCQIGDLRHLPLKNITRGKLVHKFVVFYKLHLSDNLELNSLEVLPDVFG